MLIALTFLSLVLIAESILFAKQTKEYRMFMGRYGDAVHENTQYKLFLCKSFTETDEWIRKTAEKLWEFNMGPRVPLPE